MRSEPPEQTLSLFAIPWASPSSSYRGWGTGIRLLSLFLVPPMFPQRRGLSGQRD